jgi:hypothetical protein
MKDGSCSTVTQMPPVLCDLHEATKVSISVGGTSTTELMHRRGAQAAAVDGIQHH